MTKKQKKFTNEELEEIQKTLGKKLMEITSDPALLEKAREFAREMKKEAYKDIDTPFTI